MTSTAMVESEILDELRIHCIEFDDSVLDGVDSIPGVPIAAPPASTTAACPPGLLNELRSWAEGLGSGEYAATQPPSQAANQLPLARSTMSPSVERMLREYLRQPATPPRALAGSLETNPLTPPPPSGATRRQPIAASRWIHRDLLDSRLRTLEQRTDRPTWAEIRRAMDLDVDGGR